MAAMPTGYHYTDTNFLPTRSARNSLSALLPRDSNSDLVAETAHGAPAAPRRLHGRLGMRPARRACGRLGDA
jgi:hypothetical protein